MTITNCHYDGGYSSAGVYSFAVASAFRLDGEGPDEPDATWEVTYQGCDFVDHASFIGLAALWTATFPTTMDKQLRFYVNFIDSSITDAVTVDPNSNLAGIYRANYLSQGAIRHTRSRFARSGCFDPGDGISSVGGHLLTAPPSGSIAPDFEYSNVDWVGNAAPLGPAVLALMGTYSLLFRQCLLRCAYILNPATLVRPE